MASRLLWVRLQHGEAGIERLAQACSPALAERVRAGADNAAWYELSLFIELNEQIDRSFGTGDGALYRVLARHGADAKLTTIYRLFYRVGTVPWILGRAARLWSAHYDTGRLEVRGSAKGEVEFELVDVATPSCVHCEAVAGWAERAGELSGASRCDVTRQACRNDGASRCRYRMRWE